MLDNIKTVILCGGSGSRLYPVSTDKSLIGFNGKPLIFHQVKCAASAGVGEFIIVVNESNGEAIRSSLSNLRDASIKFIVQKKPGGMARAIMAARQSIAGNPFMLLSSNDIVDSTACKAIIMAASRYSSNAALLTAIRLKSYFPGGYLVVSPTGRIKRIVEKPGRGKQPSDLVNIVVHLHLQPAMLFKYLDALTQKSDDDYEQALDNMIQDGLPMHAVTYKGSWQPIKYPWHILEALDYYSSHIKRKIDSSSFISPRAVIDGKVAIEQGVRVLEGAVIRGPSYIEKDAVVGNHALIRNSTIGRGSVVGYKTEIKHSHIGSNCWFHSNYIGDSVISDNCFFGAGAVTANFRLDEKIISSIVQGKSMATGHAKLGAFIGENTRLGVNSSIMPGIKIGSNCNIGPHVLLDVDIKPHSTVIADNKYLLKHNARTLAGTGKRNKLIPGLK